MLTHPYVSVAEFRAHPTFMDTRNLRLGGTAAEQDAALFNVLLTASQQADELVFMPLAAHEHTEHVRLTPDRLGRLRYHPEHAPVVSVQALGVGSDPNRVDEQTQLTAWIEQAGRIIVASSPGGGTGLDALQFGITPANVEVFTSWTYVAGYPHSQLVEPAAAGASTVTVRDAVGVQAGDVLRLWTPGKEEAVTVAAVAGDELELTRPLANDHAAESSISALPTAIRQAVINLAVAGLQRSGPVGEQRQGPAISSTSGDKTRSSAGNHLVTEAKRLLLPYRRIR